MIKGTKNKLITWLLEQPDDIEFEIKEYKQKRSLNANAYYWSLVNEIANKVRLSKEELHLKYLKEHGQTTLIALPPEMDLKGYIKYYEKHSETKLNGKDAIYYKVYKPSSEMNSLEFSVLLDGVIEDARSLDIPIMEDERIEEMLKEIKDETII